MTQDPGSGAPMSERMQSLLSRAVEDQLSEQRQLANVLTDVHAQLTGLAQRLDALEPSAGAEGELPTEVRDAVRLLGERIDGVARLVQERGHDLVEIRGAIDELKVSVAGSTTALGGVASGLSALPAFGDRIDALQSGMGGLHDRLRGLEELTAAANGAFERVEAQDVALRELRQAFAGVAARVSQLPGRDDIDGMLGRLAEPMEGISNRLGRLETALPSLLERLDDLGDTLREHGEQLESLGTSGARSTQGGAAIAPDRLAAVESALEDLHVRLGELRDQTADTSGYDALADRIDELHAGLLGEGGLEEQVRGRSAAAAGDGATGGDVEAVVARAVADSEARLTAHIDEAVLALAEALLKRRARTSVRAVSLMTPPPPAPATALEDVDDEDEDDEDLEDEDEDDEDREDEDDEDREDDEDDEDDDSTEAVETAPPPAVDEPAPPPAVDEPASRKRKPWWRPGG